jgi:hypothetical protein
MHHLLTVAPLGVKYSRRTASCFEKFFQATLISLSILRSDDYHQLAWGKSFVLAIGGMHHLLTAAPLGVKYSGRTASCFEKFFQATLISLSILPSDDYHQLAWGKSFVLAIGGMHHLLTVAPLGVKYSGRTASCFEKFTAACPPTITINWLGGNLSSWQ